ncbi:MAG: NAD-dependent epimerase/dehydratase family protein [Ginsengibacter sp.]
MVKEYFAEQNAVQKKILVTGGSGLVGNELIKQLLESGEKVRAIYHVTPISLSHQNLEKIQCDVLDVVSLNEIMNGITQVYHCAAIVSYDPKDKQKLFKINIEGTANVVNACLEAGVNKLLHVSSVAALGRANDKELITEKMNWTDETGNSIYGKSKYLGELEVWRGFAEGLQTVIVNPSLILGGNNWEKGSSAIFKSAYHEFKWYTDGVTGFVDVRDVAHAMILLMNSEINSERFILNGENLPYKEIFSSIARCFGKMPPHKKVTPFLAELIWRTESLKTKFTRTKPLLTKETAYTAQQKTYFDNSKISKALPNFQFTKIENTIEFATAFLKEKYSL